MNTTGQFPKYPTRRVRPDSRGRKSRLLDKKEKRERERERESWPVRVKWLAQGQGKAGERGGVKKIARRGWRSGGAESSAAAREKESFATGLPVLEAIHSGPAAATGRVWGCRIDFSPTRRRDRQPTEPLSSILAHLLDVSSPRDTRRYPAL